MSSAGSQPAPTAVDAAPAPRQSLLAHLLHALNQPLTGLQCSLELAVAGPQHQEQYIRTLNEGLELTLRMRLLVEAIRELTDEKPENPDVGDTLRLDALLREATDDLRPVAEARGVHLVVAPEPPLPVRGERSHLAQLMFRLLESALSLTRAGSEFHVSVRREQAHAVLGLSWSDAPPPPLSPFSRAELGLLVARAGWENIGALWTGKRADDKQACEIRLPLACPAEAGPGKRTRSASSEV